MIINNSLSMYKLYTQYAKRKAYIIHTIDHDSGEKKKRKKKPKKKLTRNVICIRDDFARLKTTPLWAAAQNKLRNQHNAQVRRA